MPGELCGWGGAGEELVAEARGLEGAPEERPSLPGELRGRSADYGGDDVCEAILPMRLGGFLDEPAMAGFAHGAPGVRREGLEFLDGVGEVGGVSGLVMEAGEAVLDGFGEAAGGGGEHGLSAVVGFVGDEAEGFPPDGGGEHGAAVLDETLFFGAFDEAEELDLVGGFGRSADVVFLTASAADDEFRAGGAEFFFEDAPGVEGDGDALFGDESGEVEVVALVGEIRVGVLDFPAMAEGVDAIGGNAGLDEFGADEVGDGDPAFHGVEPAAGVESFEDEGEEGGLEDGALPGGGEDFFAVMEPHALFGDMIPGPEGAADREGAEVVEVLDDGEVELLGGVVEGGGADGVDVVAEEGLDLVLVNEAGDVAGRVGVVEEAAELAKFAGGVGAIPVAAVPPEALHVEVALGVEENPLGGLLLATALPVAIEELEQAGVPGLRGRHGRPAMIGAGGW